MARLTKHQDRLLAAMARAERKGWPPQSGPELSESLGERSGWAFNKLERLQYAGLAERRGMNFSYAICWALTPAGRAALSEQENG